jgi:SH3-like domain-containing protein
MKDFAKRISKSECGYCKSIISSFILLLLVFNSCITESSNSIQLSIDKTGDKFVPDRRLGIYNIESKKGDSNSIILLGETTSTDAKSELINTLNNSGISLIDSIITLPDTLITNPYTGLVTLSVINLRRNPDHRAELVSQAILGTPVKVLKEEDSWLLVQTPDNYISWTEKSSVALLSVSSYNTWKKSERVIYIKPDGWIYCKPGGSDVIGDIVAGSILEKKSESDGYIEVKLPDGREGVVKKEEVQDFESFCKNPVYSQDKIISVATTLIGIPYLWGGRSPKGADCSGFVQSVFFMDGLILQRDASLQALHGTSVDISDGYSQLKKGDLLFFGSRENEKDHVTHVAIYIGDSEYINSSGRVMINSLDSTRTNYSYYRKNALLSARRVIGVVNDPGIVPVSEHLWY